MKSRILLLIIYMAATAVAQASDYLCRRISLDEGLSHSNVTAITRDKRGFLWIGTRFGLNRHDFERTVTYYHDGADSGSIPDNFIHKLYSDPYGCLWVCTENGLCRYNERSDSFTPVLHDGKVINARSFCEEDGGLLIGSAGSLYFHDRESGTTAKIQTKGGSNIYYSAIYRWTPGYYILSTLWDGIWLFDREHATISPMPGISDKNIKASFVDSRGMLWLSPYGRGIQLVDRSGAIVKSFNTADGSDGSDIVLDIEEVNGQIWLATEGRGITVYDPLTETFDNSTASNALRKLNSVTCIYTDAHSNIYAGTVREGAATVTPVAMQTIAGAPQQSFKAITAICPLPDGTFWLGDDGQGIAFYNPETRKISFEKSTFDLKITDIAQADSHTLLVFSFDKGIFLFDTNLHKLSPATGELAAYYNNNPNPANPIQARRIGNDLVALFSTRFCLYNPSTGKVKNVKYTADISDGLLHPFYNNNGRLLCHNLKTVFEFNALTGSLTPLVTVPGEYNIACAAFDGGNMLYVGTDSKLLRIDISTGEASAICSNVTGRVSALAHTAPDKLWIATTANLYLKKIDPGKCDESIIGFGGSDGVAPNEYLSNATSEAGGVLLFGGANGLLQISPADVNELLSDRPEPILSLADVSIDGVPSFNRISNEGLLEVPYGYSSLAFSIIDNGANSVHRQLFRYIISDGNSEKTIETFARSVDLNFLVPGARYSISASSNLPDGTWSRPQPVMRLAMLAPWWKTGPAITVFLLCLLGSIAMFEYKRSRRRAERLNSKIESYRKDVLEKELAFFVNTNNALRTPLTLIYAPVKLLLEQVRDGKHDGLETELEGIYRNTKKMRDALDMALELHKIGSDPSDKPLATHDISRSVQDTISAHRSEIDLKSVTVSYLPAEDMFPAIYDRRRIGSVLDTLLANALQRSPYNGSIVIRAMENGDNIRVIVSDHGEPLDESTLNDIFSEYSTDDSATFGNSLSFAFAKNIIELLGGTIGVNNNPDGLGIAVWFEIPAADSPSDEAYRRRRKHNEATATAPGADAVVADIDTSHLTAFVAEEDNDLCLFISRQLEPYFKKVLHTLNGKDALLLIKQNQPDIVISSVMLPMKSGLELCHDIKSSPETNHIPVVLLTAIKEGAALESAYSAGADSYISKPFDIQILLTRCRNLLHSRAVIRNRYSDSDAGRRQLTNADESFVLKVDKIIAEHISDPDFSVDTIVEAMALSRSSLYSRFKSITGGTIGAYIADKRLATAKDLLRDSGLSVSDIAEKLGFNTQRYFSTFFKERTGMSPSAYRSSINMNNESTDA